VWGISHRTRSNARAQLTARLPAEIGRLLGKLNVVDQPDGAVRVDVTPTSKRASKKVLRHLAVICPQNGWRVQAHREWAQRSHNTAKPAAIPTPNKLPLGIGTWNVSSLGGRRPEVESLLENQGLGILALQETRQTKDNLPPNFNGYTSFDRLAEKPGTRKDAGGHLRGETLLISDQYDAWEITAETTCATWVEVAGLPIAGGRALVGVIYIPPKRKTKARKEVKPELRRVSTINPAQPLIVLGDFNLDRAHLIKLLRAWKVELEPLSVRGSKKTSKAGQGEGQPDHILANRPARKALTQAKAIKEGHTSDHSPLAAKFKGGQGQPAATTPNVKEKFLPKKVLKAAEDLAFDPGWETLLALPAELPIKDLLAAFTERAKGAMALVGAVRVPAPPSHRKRKRSFPESESTKELHEERRKLRVCLRTDGKGKVEGAYIQSMRRLEGSIAQDEKEAWKARFHELCQSFTTDRRAFTKGLKALTHGATKRSTTTTIAVRDEHGRVRATPVKALEITKSYWSGIAQEANLKSLGEWEAALPLPKAVGLPRMDEEIGISEVEEAIKKDQGRESRRAGRDPSGIPQGRPGQTQRLRYRGGSGQPTTQRAGPPGKRDPRSRRPSRRATHSGDNTNSEGQRRSYLSK
jgi:exonuclease III